ncbi:hypothetical protein GFD21_03185 [Bifidobacterium sp. SMA15]|uniref:Uncharacterized protein n=2 Tax=Bifidobacterium platyrrhinorum TaxID=2661628 RepID=A0A6L9SQL8_9BIFI|nr:hypothetical protein [Bifidobacterium platyrrhinorum]
MLDKIGMPHPEPLVEDARPSGVKRNGPELAAWLDTHPGWHKVSDAANRSAAMKAAYKINKRERRGFENGGYEARVVLKDSGWLVEARRTPAPKRKGLSTEGMNPLW